MIRRFSNSIRVLLLAAFLWHFSSSVFFVHAHVYDGKVVTHSHPYIPSGTGQHSHSSSSLLLVYTLNHAQFIDTGIVQVQIALPECQYQYLVEDQSFYSYTVAEYCSLRAPPVGA